MLCDRCGRAVQVESRMIHIERWTVLACSWVLAGLKKVVPGRNQISELEDFGVMLWLAHGQLSSWSWGLAYLVRHYLPVCLEGICCLFLPVGQPAAEYGCLLKKAKRILDVFCGDN